MVCAYGLKIFFKSLIIHADRYRIRYTFCNRCEWLMVRDVHAPDFFTVTRAAFRTRMPPDSLKGWNAFLRLSAEVPVSVFMKVNEGFHSPVRFHLFMLKREICDVYFSNRIEPRSEWTHCVWYISSNIWELSRELNIRKDTVLIYAEAYPEEYVQGVRDQGRATEILVPISSRWVLA